MNKWILLISPHESLTHEWTACVGDKEEITQIMNRRDLTKEFYAMPLNDLVDIVRLHWESEEEEKGYTDAGNNVP